MLYNKMVSFRSFYTGVGHFYSSRNGDANFARFILILYGHMNLSLSVFSIMLPSTSVVR